MSPRTYFESEMKAKNIPEAKIKETLDKMESSGVLDYQFETAKAEYYKNNPKDPVALKAAVDAIEKENQDTFLRNANDFNKDLHQTLIDIKDVAGIPLTKEEKEEVFKSIAISKVGSPSEALNLLNDTALLAEFVWFAKYGKKNMQSIFDSMKAQGRQEEFFKLPKGARKVTPSGAPGGQGNDTVDLDYYKSFAQV